MKQPTKAKRRKFNLHSQGSPYRAAHASGKAKGRKADNNANQPGTDKAIRVGLAFCLM